VNDVGAMPPAGWYVDPGDESVLRYWDAVRWTEHTMPQPSPTPEPLPLAAAEAERGGWAAPGALSAATAVAVLESPTATPAAHVHAPRRHTTARIVAVAAVAGLLVGVGGGLLVRRFDEHQQQSPKAIVAAQYAPLFQRVLVDIQDITAATTDNGLIDGCTTLSSDLRAGSTLPAVTRDFDAVWGTFLTDGTTFADGCLGVHGVPGGGSSLAAALDRFTGDTNDVSVAMDRVPG
jgi:hypothetical protein